MKKLSVFLCVFGAAAMIAGFFIPFSGVSFHDTSLFDSIKDVSFAYALLLLLELSALALGVFREKLAFLPAVAVFAWIFIRALELSPFVKSGFFVTLAGCLLCCGGSLAAFLHEQP